MVDTFGSAALLVDAVWCSDGSQQQSRWSGRGKLIFLHDTGRQFWSGCISLQKKKLLRKEEVEDGHRSS